MTCAVDLTSIDRCGEDEAYGRFIFLLVSPLFRGFCPSPLWPSPLLPPRSPASVALIWRRAFDHHPWVE